MNYIGTYNKQREEHVTWSTLMHTKNDALINVTSTKYTNNEGKQIANSWNSIRNVRNLLTTYRMVKECERSNHVGT